MMSLINLQRIKEQLQINQPPSCVWGDVDLTCYVGSRDEVTVGFELLCQTYGEDLGI